MKLTLVFLHDKQLPVTLRWNNLSLCCHLVVTYLSFFGSYCYLPDFKLHINSVTTTLIHRNPSSNCLLYHHKNTLPNLKRSVNIEVHDLFTCMTLTCLQVRAPRQIIFPSQGFVRSGRFLIRIASHKPLTEKRCKSETLDLGR